MGRKGAGDGARVVVPGSDGIGYHLGDGLGVLAVDDKVGRDPGRSGDRHPAERDPLGFRQPTDVEANVGPARLPPHWQSEFVAVGRQVADAVECRR